MSEKRKRLSKSERRRLGKNQKMQARAKTKRIRLIRILLAAAVVTVAVVSGLYVLVSNQSVFPPTDQAGHVERSPSAHVIDEPMGISVQKHMLEHADGSGPPGVIINYNCKDFECEPGLIANLARIAERYEQFVYVAPYPGMSKKLAITRSQLIQTFDVFSERDLVSFIESR